MRVAAFASLLFLVAFLAACPQRMSGPMSESDKENRESLPPGDRDSTVLTWYLTQRTDLAPRIEFMADLDDSLAQYGVRVEPVPGFEFRFGYHDSVYADWIARKWENRTFSIHPDSFLLSEEPRVLFSYSGVDDDSLAIEILENSEFFEGLTGRPCEIFAFPLHDHDRRVMNLLRDAGFLCGRNGASSYEPWSSFLLIDSPHGDFDHNWDCLSLYELTLSLYSAEIMAVEPADLEAWLWEPSRLPQWIAERRWIQLYTHSDDPEVTNTAILDTDHLAALLDALAASGEVWIATVGEVAAFARQTHHPLPEDDLLWIADYQDDHPWMGMTCAFSFSTDDGFLANLYSYLPVFQARALSFTAFLNKAKVLEADAGESFYMDSAEVLQLAEAGVEIGNHSITHRPLLPQEACQLSLEAGQTATSLVIRRANHRTLLDLVRHLPTGLPQDLHEE